MFYSNYITIAKKTSDKRSSYSVHEDKISDITQAINLVFQSYKCHCSINCVNTMSKTQISSNDPSVSSNDLLEQI